MKPHLLRSIGLLLLAAAFASAIVVLHRGNERRRSRLAELVARKAQVASASADNQRIRDLLTRTRTDRADGERAIHAELVQAQAEIAELQSRAQAARARVLGQSAANARALEENRDPEKGPTKPEHLRNVGRQTPAAAFQTLAWAVLAGDDEALVNCIVISEGARAKAGAIIDALPEDLREKYRTPEKLATPFLASGLLESSSFQVLEQTTTDPQHAVLNVRLRTNGRDRDMKIPMQLGAGGWVAVVPEKLIDGIGAKLGSPADPNASGTLVPP